MTASARAFAKVEELEALVHRVNELHYPKWIKGREVCAHCRKTTQKHVAWPCDTARITRPPEDWGGFFRGEQVKLVSGNKVWLVVAQKGETVTLTDAMEDGKPTGRMRHDVYAIRLRRV